MSGGGEGGGLMGYGKGAPLGITLRLTERFAVMGKTEGQGNEWQCVLRSPARRRAS